MVLFKEEKENATTREMKKNSKEHADKDIYISMVHNIIDKLEDLITVMED